MGVMDKFKDLVGIEEYDDDDITDEEIESAGAQLERRKVDNRSTGGSYQRNRDKVVGMYSQKSESLKMIVIEPKGFDECPKLVDSLKQDKPVILNLEELDQETARKIFDFLSGATYALNGNVQKVAENIFIFAPETVNISAAAEGGGFDFSGKQDNWR